jgi:hypothetical protein
MMGLSEPDAGSWRSIEVDVLKRLALPILTGVLLGVGYRFLMMAAPGQCYWCKGPVYPEAFGALFGLFVGLTSRE